MAEDILLTMDLDEDAMRQIYAALERMSQPKQMAARAALNSAERALAAVRAAAPADTGTLRRGLVLHPERNKPQGKQVYDIWPSPKLNHVFQKQVLNPGRRPDGKRRRTIAYYPASQEYGFDTVNGGHVPGKHYMEGTLQRDSTALRDQMTKDALNEIEKAWDG